MKIKEAIYWEGEFTDKELDTEADMGLLFWEVEHLINNPWGYWAFLNNV